MPTELVEKLVQSTVDMKKRNNWYSPDDGGEGAAYGSEDD